VSSCWRTDNARWRWGFGVLVLLSTVVASGASAPVAAASTCTEQSIFVFINLGADGSYGTTNTFARRNRDLDANCPNRSAVSTAQVGSATETKQEEVGWVEYVDSGVRKWSIFWETQRSRTDSTIGYATTWTACSSCPTDLKFRVEYSTDIAGWQTFWNDGSWHRVGPTDSSGNFLPEHPGFANGWPKGETTRNGDPGTGASDYQFSLDHRSCPASSSASCVYFNWAETNTQSDSMPGWKHCDATSDSYVIQHESDPC
jgi:hypothetical protein